MLSCCYLFYNYYLLHQHHHSLHIYNNSTNLLMSLNNSYRANFPKLCGNCAIPQHFHTRKLGEITVFFPVRLYIGITMSRFSALLMDVLLLFETLDLNAALFLKISFLFLLLALLVL